MLAFDLVTTQPVGNVRYNGASEYVKRLFNLLLQSVDISKLYIVITTERVIDEELQGIIKQFDGRIIDIKNENINERFKHFKITNFFLGLAQNFSLFNLKIPVKLIVVWHDISNLEYIINKDIFYYHKANLKGIAIGLAKIVFFKLYTFIVKQKVFESMKKLIAYLSENDGLIFTDSEHSKYSILSFYPKLLAKQIVVLWAPAEIKNYLSVEVESLVGRRFFLSVSGDRWTKNSINLIRVINRMTKNGEDLPLFVITGNMDKFLIRLFFKHNSNIKTLSYVSKEELKWLYENAEALIFPSYIEGFGYPPVEAMQSGCPVLAAATSSIIEVCDGGAMFFSPYNSYDLEARIRQFLHSDKNSWKMKALERSKYISERQTTDVHSLISTLKDRT